VSCKMRDLLLRASPSSSPLRVGVDSRPSVRTSSADNYSSTRIWSIGKENMRDTRETVISRSSTDRSRRRYDEPRYVLLQRSKMPQTTAEAERPSSSSRCGRSTALPQRNTIAQRSGTTADKNTTWFTLHDEISVHPRRQSPRRYSLSPWARVA